MSGLAGLAALGGRVAVAAVVAALLVAGAAIAQRRLLALSPGLRAGLWWLVAARILLELAGAPALELAWLPVAAPAPADRIVVFSAPAEQAASESSAEEASLSPPRRRDAKRAALSLVGGIWLVSALVAALGALRALLRLRRRLASGRPAAERRVLEQLETLRAELGPKRRVRVIWSDEAATPHVVGWWRPVIVLPAGSALADDELRMALAHELLHLRRGDAWRGLVPWLAERLFAFHPSVRWAAREYVLANESACDAELVARLGASPARYGRLLLRLAAQPPDPTAAAGWALARRPIERRLEMLALCSRSVTPARGALVALALVAALAAWPVRLVGAVAADTPEPSRAMSPVAAPDDTESPSPPPETRAPEPGERRPAAPPRARRSRIAPTPPVPPVALRAPIAPATPMAPIAPRAATTPTPPATPAPAFAAAPMARVARVAPVAPASPATPAAPVSPATPVAWMIPTPPIAPREPVPPTPPPTPLATPVPPVPPVPPAAGLGRGTGFVLLDGDTQMLIDAGERDLALAERSRRGDEPVMVLRRGARARVIRDRETIDSVVALLDEQQALADRQARLAEEVARRSADVAERGAQEREELGRRLRERIGELLEGETETLEP